MLLLASLALWLAAFVPWTTAKLPVYFATRVDGKPG
jgi:hypothetical protein